MSWNEERVVPHHTGPTPLDRFLDGKIDESDVDEKGRYIDAVQISRILPANEAHILSLQEAYTRAMLAIEERDAAARDEVPYSPMSTPGSLFCGHAASSMEARVRDLEARTTVIEREITLMRRALGRIGVRAPSDPYE